MNIYTTDPQNPTAAIALAYHRAGLAILPLKTDGSRKPLIKWAAAGWQRSEWEDIAAWWNCDRPAGIGIICGGRSKGMESMDFDAHKSPSVYPQWARMIEPALLSKLVLTATPSGGIHCDYRTPTTEPSKALARAKNAEAENGETPHATIELLSEGHFVVVAGSPANTHPTGKIYDWLQGDPRHPPLLTIEERAALHGAARVLNLYHPEQSKPKTKPIDRTKLKGRKLAGDIYDQQADFADILEPHGWSIVGTKGDLTYWRKPGSNSKSSHATTGYMGLNLFHCFTTDALPFEQDHNYKPFAVFTLLNHDGDYTRAAKALMTKHL
jgi:putative DNA primase/helicase